MVEIKEAPELEDKVDEEDGPKDTGVSSSMLRYIVQSDTQAGRLVNAVYSLYHINDKTPKLRGNVHCLWYSDIVEKNQPVFTLGPQWKNAALYLFTVNIGVGTAVNCLQPGWMNSVMNLGLVLWDVVTLYLVLYNPGMAPLDPHVHRIEYLHSISRNNMEDRICQYCNLIKGENSHFRA